MILLIRLWKIRTDKGISRFKFHYDSINSEVRELTPEQKKMNLNSIMILLILGLVAYLNASMKI